MQPVLRSHRRPCGYNVDYQKFVQRSLLCLRHPKVAQQPGLPSWGRPASAEDSDFYVVGTLIQRIVRIYLKSARILSDSGFLHSVVGGRRRNHENDGPSPVVVCMELR